MSSPGQEEVNLVEEQDEEDPLVKRRKVEEEGGMRRVKQMSRQELEKLVESKITELLQYKGDHVALGKKVDKLQEENSKLSERATALGKQMADLKEVVRRVKEAEKKKGEGKVSKIPRVTRNVGLQISSTLTPVPLGQPTPSPSPSLSEEDVVVLDDDEEEEGETKVTTMEKSPKQVTVDVLPRGIRRHSLPTDELWSGSDGDRGTRPWLDGGGGGRPRSNGDRGARSNGDGGARPRVDHGGAASLSKSLQGGNYSKQQQSSSSMGSSSISRKINLPASGSLHTSLSSGSLSITRTPKSPPTISHAATREDQEPITLTVNKVDQAQGGIMIQWAWNKASNFDISKVVSYQLEGSQGQSKWTKVGEPIVPLSLPMACTLNGFKTGVTYGFRIKIQTRVNVLHSNVSKIDL